MNKITEDYLGLGEKKIGEPRRLEMVNISKDELFDLKMNLYTSDLLIDSWKILAKKLQAALPEEQFRKVLLEAIASYYDEKADYEAENMAHWMQDEFDFRMHEVDTVREEAKEDCDYF